MSKSSHIVVFLRKTWLYFLFVLFTTQLSAQTERDIFITANRFFDQGEFVSATPYYLRLLSLKPKNTFINYRYGACLLFNSDKKQEALKYLLFAVDNGESDPLARFFLGRAYHYNYLFNDAIDNYFTFKALVSEKEAQRWNVNRLMEMCENGQSLLSQYSELIVYEKKEIEAYKFFRLYDLTDLGGTIVLTEDFRSKLDEKYNHTPLIYFSPGADRVFYSSYGDVDRGNLDLYYRVKTSNGSWSAPFLMPDQLNTPYDEDYVYFHEATSYLYFSSEGHNSMGGFDVFRCKYDPNTGELGALENLDFAISSPDDDFFFLVDASGENGYFASARQSELGKLFVYKIRVEKIPTQLSIVSGRFTSKYNPQAIILIEIKEKASGKLIGNFQSDPSGMIVFSFPKGGDYEYNMRIIGSDKTFHATVRIPELKSLTPLRQNIVHTAVNGKEVVVVDDQFQEEIPKAEKEQIIADIFRKKASLDPNSEMYDLNRYALDEHTLLKRVGSEKKSIGDLESELAGKMRKMAVNKERIKRFESERLTSIGNQLDELEGIEEQLADLADEYKNETNEIILSEILQQAENLMIEKNISSRRLDKLVREYEDFTSVSGLSSINAQNAEKWKFLAEQLNLFLAEERKGEALQLMAANIEEFKNLLQTDFSDFSEKNDLKLKELDDKISRLQADKMKLLQDLAQLESDMVQLEEAERKARRGKLEEIKSTIIDKKQTIMLYKSEIASLDTRIERIAEDKEMIKAVLVNFEGGMPSDFIVPDTLKLSLQAKIARRKVGSATVAEIFFEKEIQKAQMANTLVQSADPEWQLDDLPTIEEEISIWDGSLYNDPYMRIIIQELDREYLADEAELRKSLDEEKSSLSAYAGNDNRLKDKVKTALLNPNLPPEKKQQLRNLDTLLQQKLDDLRIAQLTQARTKDRIIEETIPGFASQMNFIAKNEGLNDRQKLLAMTQWNNDLVEELNNQEKYFASLIERNPDHTALQAKKALINKVKIAKLAEIDEAERALNGINALLDDRPMLASSKGMNEVTDKELEQMLKVETDDEIVARLNPFLDNKNWRESGYQNNQTIEENETVVIESTAMLNKVKKELSVAKSISGTDENMFLLEGKIRQLEDLYDRLQSKLNYEKKKLLQQKNAAAEEIAIIAAQKNRNPEKELNAELRKNALNKAAELEKIIQRESELAKIKEEEQLKRAAQLQETEKAVEKIAENKIADREKIIVLAHTNYFNNQTDILSKHANNDYQFFKESLDNELRLRRGLTHLESLPTMENLDRAMYESVVKQNEQEIVRWQNELRVFPETREKLMIRLYPDYLKTQLMLQSDASNMENLEERNKIDRDMIAMLKMESVDINTLSNIAAPKIQRKKDEIQLVISLLENDIAARNAQKVAMSKSSNFAKPDNEKAKNASTTAAQYTNNLKKISAVDQLRQELLGANSQIMTYAPNNLEDLTRLRRELINYKLDLDVVKEAYEFDNKKDFGYSQTIVGDEMERVDNRLSRIDQQILSLQEDSKLTEPTEKTEVIVAQFNDALLQKLTLRENDLLKQLEEQSTMNPGLVKNYQRAHEARLTRENYLLLKQGGRVGKATENKLVNIQNIEKKTGMDSHAAIFLIASEMTERIEDLERLAEKTKKPESANFYLEKAYHQRMMLDRLVEQAYLEARVHQITKGKLSTLQSYEAIQQSLLNLELERNQLMNEQKILKESLLNMKKRKTRKDLNAQLNLLDLRLKQLNKSRALAENQLVQLKPKNYSFFNPNARSTYLSHQSEKEIAKSADYKVVARAGFDLLEVESLIVDKRKQIEQQKKILNQIIQSNTSSVNNDAITKEINVLAKLEDDLKRLDSLATERSVIFQSALPADSNLRLSMQNMILRGIDPIVQPIKKANFVPISSQELVISTANITEQPIPLEVPYPSGLVYRVQLGAYDKPLENNLFKELNPVDGTLAVNGLYIYRAGYFKKYDQAMTNQGRIRTRGYADAFIVAFCNGERITIKEARRLEATGGCDPVIEPENSVIPQGNLRAEKAIDSTLQKSYNQSKYAVEAKEVENISGLFFTVQVGVFNRPADDKLLPDLKDLYTVRLDNGLIRYSTGMFSSINVAQEEKIKTISKGYKDAFITAYYNSKRITLNEARELLQQQGETIFADGLSNPSGEDWLSQDFDKLAFEDSTFSRSEKVKDYDFMTDQDVMVDPNQPVQLKDKLPNRVQLVSNKSYDEFPREVLNRFNSHAPFYYDEVDKKVKSPVYQSINQIPQVYLIREDIDTVYFYVDEVAQRLSPNSENRILTFEVPKSGIQGGLADYLIRLNYRKEYLKKAESIQIDILGVPEEKVQMIVNEMQRLQINPRVITGY